MYTIFTIALRKLKSNNCQKKGKKRSGSGYIRTPLVYHPITSHLSFYPSINLANNYGINLRLGDSSFDWGREKGRWGAAAVVSSVFVRYCVLYSIFWSTVLFMNDEMPTTILPECIASMKSCLNTNVAND